MSPVRDIATQWQSLGYVNKRIMLPDSGRLRSSQFSHASRGLHQNMNDSCNYPSPSKTFIHAAVQPGNPILGIYHWSPVPSERQRGDHIPKLNRNGDLVGQKKNKRLVQCHMNLKQIQTFGVLMSLHNSPSVASVK